jgi:hypothetical protein
MPHAPDHPPALQAARKAVAELRPDAGSLVALILALLLRVLARLDPAWVPPEDDEDHYEHEYDAACGFDAYAFCGADPYALYPRPVGRAPHAACIEAGLVPDWILPGIRNRGMRPHARPTGKKPSPLGGEGWVRGPPRPYAAKNTPQPGGRRLAPILLRYRSK